MVKPLQRKVGTYAKGREYFQKHGYIRLLCIVCGKEFTCSAQCLFNPQYYGKRESLSENSCLCGNCDTAKRNGSMKWFNGCAKEFPDSWVRRVMEGEKNGTNTGN